ncbi:MAG: hypothetical protein AABX31_04305 [Nanoarchaeota archaeon]
MSDKNITRLGVLSALGIVGGVAGAVYFGRATPLEKHVFEMNEERDSIITELVKCAPRDRKTSLSDMCINYARRYDLLSEEVARAEKDPAYISASRDKSYSVGLVLVAFFSWMGTYVLIRKKEENVNEIESQK